MSNDKTAKKSLKQRAEEMTAQLPIMTDRTKEDAASLIGQIVTIRDYGFMNGKDGQYVVFIVDEEKDAFFFGGSVLTKKMEEFEADGFHADVLAEGLPILLTKKKAKDSGRTYVDVKFYPEV